MLFTLSETGCRCHRRQRKILIWGLLFSAERGILSIEIKYAAKVTVLSTEQTVRFL